MERCFFEEFFIAADNVIEKDRHFIFFLNDLFLLIDGNLIPRASLLENERCASIFIRAIS